MTASLRGLPARPSTHFDYSKWYSGRTCRSRWRNRAAPSRRTCPTVASGGRYKALPVPGASLAQRLQGASEKHSDSGADTSFRRTLMDRVEDVTPTLDGLDVTVHRGKVRTHCHDGYVAPTSIAPSRDIAGPSVVPASVLLDGLETERFTVSSQFDKPGFDPRLDLD